MSESILVGLVIGAGVAAIGAFVGHRLRLREMKAQWDEDERRRESERRRGLLERELAVITEFADVNSDLWNGILWWAPTGKLLSTEARAEMGREAFVMHARANAVALSLGDERLNKGVKKLIELMKRCNGLLDPETAGPVRGSNKSTWKLLQICVLRQRRYVGEVESSWKRFDASPGSAAVWKAPSPCPSEVPDNGCVRRQGCPRVRACQDRSF